MTITVGRPALVCAKLIISQGSDNYYPFRYTEKFPNQPRVPIDLSGYTARSQIRNKVGGVIWTEPVITLGGATGMVEVSIAAADTEPEIWNGRKFGKWDVELIAPGGEVVRFAEGDVEVSADVTR